MESHWNLLTAYILTGQNSLAAGELTKMEEMGLDYSSMVTLQRLTKIYSAVKNFQEITLLYEKMIELEPANADLYAKLAAAYKELGQIAKAKEAVQKALELNPDFKEEAEAFLKSLEE